MISLNKMNLDLIIKKSKAIEKTILRVGFECGQSAHFGGALSLTHILSSLFFGLMKHDPLNPRDPHRDRFILSKGHGVLAYIATLYESGYISAAELATFQKDDSKFIAHPVKNLDAGIETSSGSLGQGICFAIGVAEALKRKKSNNRVYVICGDGECNEGSVWEAAMLANKRKLDNFTLFIDKNNFQNDGHCADVLGDLDLKKMFESFGFNAHSVNGHNVKEICNVASLKQNNKKPTVIVCNTIKGYGVSFMENQNDWHHNRLTKKLIENEGLDINVL